MWEVVEITGVRALPEYGYFVAFNGEIDQGCVGLILPDGAYPMGFTFGQALRMRSTLNTQLKAASNVRNTTT